MTSSDTSLETVVTYSESLALAGLKEQWELGDPLAVVEAITICGKEKDPYPDWVCQVLNDAMTQVYVAVYSIELDNRAGKRPLIRSEDELKWRLDRARDQLLQSLGLSADRDNAGKIRKRLLRDAYLAELIAQRCQFIATPTPAFKGVNKALDDLAEIFDENGDQDEKRRRLPSECWGAKSDTIKRAWSKHKDDLANFFLQNPHGPVSPLDWFLGFAAHEPERD